MSISLSQNSPVHSRASPPGCMEQEEDKAPSPKRGPGVSETVSKSGSGLLTRPCKGAVCIMLPSGDLRWISTRKKHAARLGDENKNRSLLAKPIELIMEDIRKDMHARELETRRKYMENEVKPWQDGEQALHIEDRLWVEKYASKSFGDLLSDDTINRQVANWMTSWDSIVFPKKIKQKTNVHDVNSFLKFNPQVQQSQRQSESDQLRQNNAEGSERPFYKVILLSGPPGSGKTTLAHLIAQHCGYRICEVNSSDDRSAESIKKRIYDAVQMQSVNFDDRRPNCLILDEIDGVAATGAKNGISVLVDLIQASDKLYLQRVKKMKSATSLANKSSTQEFIDSDAGEDVVEESSASRIKSIAKSSLLINRPIICICNDLYSPVLRPLRQIAKVFQFGKISTEKLAERLKTVCCCISLHFK